MHTYSCAHIHTHTHTHTHRLSEQAEDGNYDARDVKKYMQNIRKCVSEMGTSLFCPYVYRIMEIFWKSLAL